MCPWRRWLGAALFGAIAVSSVPAAARSGATPATTRTAASAPRALGRRSLAPSFRPKSGRDVPVAFFDADDTLRTSRAGGPSANGPKDVKLLPGVARRIRQLNRRGVLVAIVSNQAGIPKFVSMEAADAALARTIHLIRKRGGRVDYYDFAEARDENRKPDVGMATRLDGLVRERFGRPIDRSRSFMVGDAGYKRGSESEPGDVRPDGRPGTDFSNSDRRFAENLGIPYHHPADFFRKPRRR